MNIRHILIVRYSYERIGGVENQILHIGREFNKTSNYKVSLATDKIDSPLAIEFKKYGKVFFVDLRSLSILKSASFIVNILRAENISIIQSHLFKESIICRLVKFRYPQIYHVFRAQTYIDCARIIDFKKLLYHILDFLTSKYVTVYLANGPKVEWEIINRSKISVNKVTNIINGTDVLGEPDILKNDSLPVKIAMVSNLMENKGHDILIAALGLLKKRGLKIDTVLIGDEITNGLLKRRDSFKSQIIIKAKENDVLDQLIFYGYSYQIPVALYEIPIVVLPSDSEGVPNCILEAMSLKKIVVASDVGSVSSIIDHGKNGFLHQPRNVEQLSNLLEMIFNAPIEKMNTLREEAYLKWQNCFSLNRMINGFIKAYDEL